MQLFCRLVPPPSAHPKNQYFSDVDECATGKDKCGTNAVCNNTKGTYHCTCKPGYYEVQDKCEKGKIFALGYLSLCSVYKLKC